MKTMALVSILFRWLIGILFITLAHGDLFSSGRTESFALTLNAIFIISTGLVAWACQQEIKKKRIRYLTGIATWTALAILFGLPSHLLEAIS